MLKKKIQAVRNEKSFKKSGHSEKIAQNRVNEQLYNQAQSWPITTRRV